MKVLVTGAAGFIGSHLCEKLVSSGISVFGLDNYDHFYARAIKEKNISLLLSNPLFHFRELDICENEALARLLKDNPCDLVVHLAAKTSARLSLSKPLDYADSNVKATFSVLDAMVQSGVKNIIFGSSSSVYGKTTVIPFREDDLFDYAVSPYGCSKQCAELAMKMYHNQYNFNVINLRFFTVFGPRERPDHLMYKLLYALLTNRPMDFYGDEKITRDYIYIADAIEGIFSAISRLLEQKNKHNNIFEVYNIGSSKPVSLKELKNILEKITGAKTSLVPKPETGADVPTTFANIDRAKTFLNFNPTTSLEEGIKKFKDWMSKEIL